MHRSFLKPDKAERQRQKFLKPRAVREDNEYLREQCNIAKKLDGNRCRNAFHVEWITEVFGVEVLKSQFCKLIDPDHCLGRSAEFLHHRFINDVCRVCHGFSTDGITLESFGFLNNNIVRIIILSARRPEKDFRHDECLKKLIAKEYPKLTKPLCKYFGVVK